MTEGPLDDRVALVTGASSGLGRATALALGAAGASVALLARSRDDLEETARELDSHTGLGQALGAEGREQGIRTCVLYPS